MNTAIVQQSTQCILLDCDGVLVDNTIFERRVSQFLISHLAVHLRTTEARAKSVWAETLAATRDDWRWYDYKWHARRLGLDPVLAEFAHRQAGHLLAEVPGARDTLSLIKSLGLSVGIVTDATKWVAAFKLDQLGIDEIDFIVSSDEMTAVKTSGKYWRELAVRAPTIRPLAIVDNRIENLEHAGNQFSGAILVQFHRQEHVTQLPTHVRPLRRRGPSGLTIDAVTDHARLRQFFHDSIGPGRAKVGTT